MKSFSAAGEGVRRAALEVSAAERHAFGRIADDVLERATQVSFGDLEPDMLV